MWSRLTFLCFAGAIVMSSSALAVDPVKPADPGTTQAAATTQAPATTPAAATTPATGTPAGVAYFENHIRPLLIEHCYQCHSVEHDQREGGLLLDRRSGWLRGGDSGPAIVPGNADASLIMRAVHFADPDLRMPPDSPLTEEAIARLGHWIAIGAPDPRDDGPGSVPPRQNPSDPVAGRDHWAFRPLRSDAGTGVDMASGWPRSNIDTYVMARLEGAGLRPSPDAGRRDLVRRVYVTLIGLPPTARQMHSFVDDQRPDAYSRLIDQLLSRPQFGERFGRHWLDLARYADSNGLDENFLFREAWRYRNWVIESINTDLPYDRFLLEQIAGDLLPHDTLQQRDRQRIAAGFLVIGPKVLLGNDPSKQRMEIADEQLDTIGRAILAQTLGCARCHNHKFDPIPTADYYSMAGILTSTEVVETRYMLGQQRVMERLVGLGEGGQERDESYEKYWRELPALKEKAKHVKSALEHLEKNEEEPLQKLAKEHSEAVVAEALDRENPIDRRIEVQKSLLAELVAQIAAPAPIPPRAMIPRDADAPTDEPIRVAGQFDRPGDPVRRGVLTVLGGETLEIETASSGRIELGRWLTDTDQGAGHLAARVIANRVWKHLIGRGIVSTVDNFGRTGEAATHPELLDHLAETLIRSRWSIKALVRSIVLSRTFTMSSEHCEKCAAIDPDNRLLWRAHRRRKSPETLRDSMLAAAGTLDRTPMQSSVWYLGDQATAVGKNTNRRRTDFPCRSVYLPIIRNDLPELFQAFDFADPHVTTGMRAETTVATQGLFMLNHQSVMDAAEATAKAVLSSEPSGDPQHRMDRMYLQVLGTGASESERNDVLSFIADTQQRLREQGDNNPELRAWSIACHALFASSRFQILP
jgi:hypothetical protein